MLQIGLLEIAENGVVGERARGRWLVEGQEVGVARTIHALVVEIHPGAFMQHGDAWHAALGDVGRHDDAAARVEHLDRVAGLDAEPGGV